MASPQDTNYLIQNEEFSIDSSEASLLETFASWLRESKIYHDELLKGQKTTYNYYVGDQTDKYAVASYKSNVVINRLYEAVETIVPVATASAHQFIVLPGSENELSVQKAEKLQKVLSRKYETLLMQEKLENVTRSLLLYRFGVLKYVWDEVKDDIDVKLVDPRLILIPKIRLDPNSNEFPYIIEVGEYTKQELEDYFPKVDTADLRFEDELDVGKDKESKKTCRVYEVWTNELVVWISSGKVLEKKANPYFDFAGEEKTYFSAPSKRNRKKLIFRNHLDRPEKPYTFFSAYNVGDSPFGSISLAEAILPIQDGINVQQRQIINNLRRLGSGQVRVDSDAMSQEEADNITDEEGIIIRGEGVASQNKVIRDPGIPIPEGHFRNLSQLMVIFDNIMGVHGATRGQAAAPTLGQDIISRQKDFSRIDLITRVLKPRVLST